MLIKGCIIPYGKDKEALGAIMAPNSNFDQLENDLKDFEDTMFIKFLDGHGKEHEVTNDENLIKNLNAIKEAYKLASVNDVVLVAGKGHEDYQILANETIHFDDREKVREIFG